MSSFELDRTVISLSHHETISFKMSEVEYLMLYTNFSIGMVLVNVEYTCTKS